MKSRLWMGLVAVLGVVFSAQVFGATFPGEVKQVIRDRVDSGKTMSIAAAFFDADGVEYFSYGKTTAGGADVNENTVYEIGSISKVFTAILLADMARKGEVALDDPISKYLPDTVTVPTRGDQAITLAHLSVQTSGLARMPNNFKPKDPGNPFADYTPELLYAYLGTAELQTDVGAEYAYSNTGVGLLGHLLSRAAGKDYETMVVERIATPLGMPDTRVKFTVSMLEHLAKGHVNGKEVKNWDLDALAGAGALRSTTKDMVRFLQANVGLVESPLYGAMEDTHEPRAEAGSKSMHIGLGWHILTTGTPRDIVWHNGGTGGYGTFAGFVKANQTGAVVLMNSVSELGNDIGYHLLDASVPMAGTVKRDKITLPVETLAQYPGRYILDPSTSLVVELKDGALRTRLTGQAWLPLHAEAEDKFFVEEVDAQVVFEKDAEGKVVKATLSQSGASAEAKRAE